MDINFSFKREFNITNKNCLDAHSICLFYRRLNRDTPKSQQQSSVPPPPTPPPKPSRYTPTPSEFYYKDIVETTLAPFIYRPIEVTEQPSSSENIPTVPNILKFYLSDASDYQHQSNERPVYQESFYRPTNDEEPSEKDDEEEQTYDFEQGSKFYNNTEFFPQFVTNTVAEFSNPAGEDGM